MKTKRCRLRPASSAFTLIELLIVVAIIAILALIAVPNFLEAQTRAKVSRGQTDMRSIAVALEAYRVDHDAYPPCINPVLVPPGAGRGWRVLIPLTTPVAYLTSIPMDVWSSPGGGKKRAGYQYREKECLKDQFDDSGNFLWAKYEPYLWMLSSKGPDMVWGDDPKNAYDPTNGTVSAGDIFRFGP